MSLMLFLTIDKDDILTKCHQRHNQWSAHILSYEGSYTVTKDGRGALHTHYLYSWKVYTDSPQLLCKILVYFHKNSIIIVYSIIYLV